MALISLFAMLLTTQGGKWRRNHVAALQVKPVIVDIRVGEGKLVEQGDRVTIHYRVTDPGKKELANSMKRGLTYTMVFGGRNSDPLVMVALAGMHVGGSRYAKLPAEMFATGIGSIVPPRTDLTVWVHVIAAATWKGAKVESSNAERAQGAMEVPRVAAHNGSARTTDPL